MSIAIDTACMECMFRRNLETCRKLGTEAQAIAFTKRWMQMVLEAPAGVASPWFGPRLADLLQEMYGLEIDRFRQEKIDSNRFVLERLADIRARVMGTEDPVYAGLQFSILGNYLDFAALQGRVSFDALDEMMEAALEMELDKDNYRAFCRDMEQGKELLYLTDNAGEIGFDRVFAEAIAERYPHVTITFCVRGSVTQNDATREDAAAMGIPFRIIDNGNRIAGTQIDLLSEEAREALDRADVILAKGMGNCETMFGCGYNVYYAFLVKCQRFANHFQKPMMTPLLEKERK